MFKKIDEIWFGKRFYGFIRNSKGVLYWLG